MKNLKYIIDTINLWDGVPPQKLVDLLQPLPINHGDVPSHVRHIPLIHLCSEWLVPSYTMENVVHAVLFFTQGGLNDASACAKRIITNHDIIQVQFVCASISSLNSIVHCPEDPSWLGHD